MRQRVILASASPRRSQLMRQIGLRVEAVPSMIEETTESESPDQVVEELSRQKAQDVASRYGENTIVIGSDTVVAVNGKILGKPVNHKDAVDMLSMIQGHTHQVHTGVTIIRCGNGGEAITFSECTDVTVFPMDEDEIVSYVESGEPMDKAGAYGIQGKFAAFIQEISGDYNNVVGLPVGRVYQELKKFGVSDLYGGGRA